MPVTVDGESMPWYNNCARVVRCFSCESYNGVEVIMAHSFCAVYKKAHMDNFSSSCLSVCIAVVEKFTLNIKGAESTNCSKHKDFEGRGHMSPHKCGFKGYHRSFKVIVLKWSRYA